MLLDNEYVAIISVDFTKACDRVRHHALSIKYLQLDLSYRIHNWLMDYFKRRGHLTRVANVYSLIAWINASISQGSGLGPPWYVVEASDLHPQYSHNTITKFADDPYMLVGSTSIGTINEEFNNIEKWAKNYNMKVHTSKTKEVIVSRPRSKIDPLQPFIDGAERVSTLRILGVVLNSRLIHCQNTHPGC